MGIFGVGYNFIEALPKFRAVSLATIFSIRSVRNLVLEIGNRHLLLREGL